MRRNAVLFGCLTALAFAVVSILQIISAIKGLSDLGSGSGEIYYFAKGAIIFELLASIALLITCLVSIGIVFKDGTDKRIYYSTTSILTLFTITSIIDTFLAYTLLLKMAGPYADYISMPGTGVAKLIFLFIAVILFATGDFLLRSIVHDDKAGAVLATGSGCLVVCCIISFAAMDSNTGGLVIAATIFLLIGCLLALAEFVNSYAGGYSTRTSVTHHTSSSYRPYSYTPVSSNEDGDNAAEELRKLKKLYDDGVITAQEYEEKRKKYVDKL